MKATFAVLLSVTGLMLLAPTAEAARGSCKAKLDKSASAAFCRGCETEKDSTDCVKSAESLLKDTFSGCAAYPTKNISSPPAGGSQVADVQVTCVKTSGSSETPPTNPINPPVETNSGGAR